MGKRDSVPTTGEKKKKKKKLYGRWYMISIFSTLFLFF